MTEQQITNIYNRIKKIKKAWFIVFNLAYVAMYIAYASISFYNNNMSVSWLPYAIIAVAIVYFISFLFILTIKNEKTVKIVVKNYKIMLKMLKNGLRLFNLILSIMMIVNGVNGGVDRFSFALIVINIILICFQVLTSTYKFIRTNYHRKRKEAKKQLVKDLFVDVLSIIFSYEVNEQDVDENDEQLKSYTNKPISENLSTSELATSNNTISEYKQKKSTLKTLALNYFANSPHPIKKLKKLLESGFVNALVNADSIIDRVTKYNTDKQHFKHKQNDKNDENNN